MTLEGSLGGHSGSLSFDEFCLGGPGHLDELYQQWLFVVLKAREDLADQTQRLLDLRPPRPRRPPVPSAPLSWLRTPLNVCSNSRAFSRDRRHETLLVVRQMLCSFCARAGDKYETPLNRAMRHSDQGELSAPQAARMLGVSLGTVCRWSDLGYLTSFQTERGQRRFSQEQIDRFIGMLEHEHVDPLMDRKTG
jgi:excisionase family DNA binding protein